MPIMLSEPLLIFNWGLKVSDVKLGYVGRIITVLSMLMLFPAKHETARNKITIAVCTLKIMVNLSWPITEPAHFRLIYFIFEECSSFFKNLTCLNETSFYLWECSYLLAKCLMKAWIK